MFLSFLQYQKHTFIHEHTHKPSRKTPFNIIRYSLGFPLMSVQTSEYISVIFTYSIRWFTDVEFYFTLLYDRDLGTLNIILLFQCHQFDNIAIYK